MKNEINEAIKLLKEVVSENKLKISDDKLLEEALDLFVSQKIETGKDKRMQTYSSPTLIRKEEPATDKQIQFLKNSGIEIKKGLTKREAYQIIKEAKEGYHY